MNIVILKVGLICVSIILLFVALLFAPIMIIILLGAGLLFIPAFILLANVEVKIDEIEGEAFYESED